LSVRRNPGGALLYWWAAADARATRGADPHSAAVIFRHAPHKCASLTSALGDCSGDHCSNAFPSRITRQILIWSLRNDSHISGPANSTNGLAVVAPENGGPSARTKILIEFNGRSAGAVFTYLLNCDQSPAFEVKILKGAGGGTGRALPGPRPKCWN
jgi:hypothetical protein